MIDYRRRAVALAVTSAIFVVIVPKQEKDKLHLETIRTTMEKFLIMSKVR